MKLFFQHLFGAFKEAFAKWEVERLNKIIEASIVERAKAKERALKAQAKRDALLTK